MLNQGEVGRGQYSRWMPVRLDTSRQAAAEIRKKEDFELVMAVRKSCCLGGCVEGLQKGSTVWRGFGSNGAHTGNGEVSASSRVSGRR